MLHVDRNELANIMAWRTLALVAVWEFIFKEIEFHNTEMVLLAWLGFAASFS